MKDEPDFIQNYLSKSASRDIPLFHDYMKEDDVPEAPRRDPRVQEGKDFASMVAYGIKQFFILGFKFSFYVILFGIGLMVLFAIVARFAG